MPEQKLPEYKGNFVSFEQAKELLGEHFCADPEIINELFGTKIPKFDVVPFTVEEIESIREREDLLFFQIAADAKGRPLSIRRVVDCTDHCFNEDMILAPLLSDQTMGQFHVQNPVHKRLFYERQMPREGFMVIENSPLPESFGKDYFGQAQALYEYLIRRDMIRPNERLAQPDEFFAKVARILNDPQHGWHEAISHLREFLPADGIYRRSAVEAVYQHAYTYYSGGFPLFHNSYDWTSSAETRFGPPVIVGGKSAQFPSLTIATYGPYEQQSVLGTTAVIEMRPYGKPT